MNRYRAAISDPLKRLLAAPFFAAAITLGLAVALNPTQSTAQASLKGFISEVHGIGVVEGIDGSYVRFEVVRQYPFGAARESSRLVLRVVASVPPALGIRSGTGYIDQAELGSAERALAELLSVYRRHEEQRPGYDIEAILKVGSGIEFGIRGVVVRQHLYVRAGAEEVPMDVDQWQAVQRRMSEALARIRGLSKR